MQLINLTHYEINITGHGVVKPSGIAVKSHSHLAQVDTFAGIPLMVSVKSGVSNMPEPAKDTMYIVPAYIREALPDRHDVASPTKLIRDTNGVITGCGALEVNARE